MSAGPKTRRIERTPSPLPACHRIPKKTHKIAPFQPNGSVQNKGLTSLETVHSAPSFRPLELESRESLGPGFAGSGDQAKLYSSVAEGN